MIEVLLDLVDHKVVLASLVTLDKLASLDGRATLVLLASVDWLV